MGDTMGIEGARKGSIPEHVNRDGDRLTSPVVIIAREDSPEIG